MSKTLKLPEQLLAQARDYLRVGRDQEALHILGKLARFNDLPAEIAEAAQVHLADIHLRRRSYPKARRHLDVALIYQPESACYHHLVATALDQDEDGDSNRARYHYCKAVELDPEQPAYHCDYGLCLIDQGKPRKGLQELERAVELAPDESRYLRHLAMHLIEADQPAKARRLALMARFRNPRDSRFRKLWSDLRFYEAQRRQQQETQRYSSVSKQVPAVLPFVPKKRPAARRVVAENGTILRLDPAGAPSRPHLPQRIGKRQV